MKLNNNQFNVLRAIGAGLRHNMIDARTMLALERRGLVNLQRSWGGITGATMTTNGKIVLESIERDKIAVEKIEAVGGKIEWQ